MPVKSTEIVVRTFYPADPAGVVPGGVDTFIRGLVKWAPDDLRFDVVGMTTQPDIRPVGRWTICDLGRRQFNFLPVVAVANAAQRSRVPLSVRYMYGLHRHWRDAREGYDVAEFHRVEPAMMFLRDGRPKNGFFHQDMAVIRQESKADILWRYFPRLYFKVESRVVRSLDSGWCVREEGVQALQHRYPAKASVFNFIPTWVDTEIFSPPDSALRAEARQELASAHGLDPTAIWLVSVGRLDTQKDPQLLLQSFAALASEQHRLCLLVVGDGVLRANLQKAVDNGGLGAKVAFLGLRSAPQIARIMAASDVFALSSAYEGMPMALLEGLACGLPAATTDVGEVRRVVFPGVNGAISAERSVPAFTEALREVLAGRLQYGGRPALDAVAGYRPHIVLRPVYDNYRELGRQVFNGPSAA